MNNFTVFEFNDNDFQASLKKAIEYVYENALEELTIDELKYFVVTALYAFHSIRRIDKFSFRHKNNNNSLSHAALIDYFDRALSVSYSQEIPVTGEGFVRNNHMNSVYYYGH